MRTERASSPNMATLLCYGVLLRYTFALPTAPSASVNLSADSSTASYATTSDGPAFDTNYRSTAEIVWSCLTVIIASSWLCVHPNVTGHSTTMWQRLRERLLLFVLAIFAPELLAVFASYQWWGSRKLYQKFKERAEKLNIPLILNSEASTLEGPETANDSNGQAEQPPDLEDRSAPAGITRTRPSEESDKLLGSAGRADTGLWSAISRFWKGMMTPIKTLACTISSCGTDLKQATWSYTHAHFVQMGGIVFRDDEGNTGFKRPEDWEDEDLREFFVMKLHEAAISDKSKAGALAKTLVVARVLWFLIQAIARKAQGLPIALLEVASLAFIAFNFTMYLFWWSKPLDVEYPLEIPGILGESDTLEDTWLQATCILIGRVDGIPVGLWLYSAERQWYPRFYSFSRQVVGLQQADYILGPIIAVASSSFGAFHTIGWYLPAPSQVERTLWRVSCLGLTLYPIALLAIFVSWTSTALYISSKFRSTLSQKRFDHVMNVAALIIAGIGLLGCIFYTGARLIILFLPFFELRDLPPLVHQTVSWSRFLSPI